MNPRAHSENMVCGQIFDLAPALFQAVVMYFESGLHQNRVRLQAGAVTDGKELEMENIRSPGHRAHICETAQVPGNPRVLFAESFHMAFHMGIMPEERNLALAVFPGFTHEFGAALRQSRQGRLHRETLLPETVYHNVRGHRESF